MTAQFRSYVRPLPMVVRRRHPLGFNMLFVPLGSVFRVNRESLPE